MDELPIDRDVARDYRDLAWRALDEALLRSQAFERRASVLLSTVAGTLAVLIAVLSLINTEDLTGQERFFAGFALVLLIICGALCVLTMLPLKIRRVDSKVLRSRWIEQRQDPELDTQIIAHAVTDLVELVKPKRGKPSSVISSAEWEARIRGRLLTGAMWTMLAALICLACTGFAVLSGTM